MAATPGVIDQIHLNANALGWVFRSHWRERRLSLIRGRAESVSEADEQLVALQVFTPATAIARNNGAITIEKRFMDSHFTAIVGDLILRHRRLILRSKRTFARLKESSDLRELLRRE